MGSFKIIGGMPRVLIAVMMDAAYGIAAANDTIYVNGTNVTMNDGTDIAEAVAVADGMITSVGTRSEIEAIASSKSPFIECSCTGAGHLLHRGKSCGTRTGICQPHVHNDWGLHAIGKARNTGLNSTTVLLCGMGR